MALSLNGSTGISGINGSAGTPALQGGDADTGIFFGTDTASISTAGTRRIHVDSSGAVAFSNSATFEGNVTIGKTTSGASDIGARFIKGGTTELLTVDCVGGGDTDVAYQVNNDGSPTMQIKADGTAVFGTFPNSVNIATYQLVRYNASTQPNIVCRKTDSLFNSSNAFEVQNNAATVTASITGNGTIYTAGGLNFSSVAPVSPITSNTLDDYEEGTYSPTIRGWTGTYDVQDGTYTKIGRRVTINGQVRTNGGTGSFTYSFPMVSTPFASTGVDPANDVAGTWSLTSGASSTLTSSTTIIGAGSWDGPGVGAVELFPNNYQVGNILGNFSISYIDASQDVEFRFYMSYNI